MPNALQAMAFTPCMADCFWPWLFRLSVLVPNDGFSWPCQAALFQTGPYGPLFWWEARFTIPQLTKTFVTLPNVLGKVLFIETYRNLRFWWCMSGWSTRSTESTGVSAVRPWLLPGDNVKRTWRLDSWDKSLILKQLHKNLVLHQISPNAISWHLSAVAGDSFATHGWWTWYFFLNTSHCFSLTVFLSDSLLLDGKPQW